MPIRDTPLTPADDKAFSIIANDPEFRFEVMQGLKKRGFVDHPAVKEHIDFEARLSTHLKPLQEENAELKKRQDAIDNERIYSQQRDSVRKGPFYFNDEKIKKLEEYMSSKDAGQYMPVDSKGRTAYQRAAMEYAHENSPVSESTFPVMDFTGPSRKSETWRESLTESDKSKNPLYMNRRERRRLGDKLWEEAKNEELAKLQNR
jgi:hypothetical protein